MTIGEAAQGAGAEPPQAAWAGLVGRADVLAQLGRAIEDAAGGRGRLVLLTGEAGIGKTSVAAQAAADAETAGARVVWGGAGRARGRRPTGPGSRCSGPWSPRTRDGAGWPPTPPRWPGSCPSCRGRPPRRLPAARVLVLATYRDLDSAPDDPLAPLLADLAARATVVPLPALSEAEVA